MRFSHRQTESRILGHIMYKSLCQHVFGGSRHSLNKYTSGKHVCVQCSLAWCSPCPCCVAFLGKAGLDLLGGVALGRPSWLWDADYRVALVLVPSFVEFCSDVVSCRAAQQGVARRLAQRLVSRSCDTYWSRWSQTWVCKPRRCEPMFASVGFPGLPVFVCGLLRCVGPVLVLFARPACWHQVPWASPDFTRQLVADRNAFRCDQLFFGCFAAATVNVIFRKTGPDGDDSGYHIGLHHFGSSGVLAWPVDVCGFPGHDQVKDAKLRMDLQRPVVMTIMSWGGLKGFAFEWKSVAWQSKQFHNR